MFPYSLTCTQCSATLKYSEEFFGKTVPCPRCQLPITVPFPEELAFDDNPITADEVVEDEEPVLAEVMAEGAPSPNKPKTKKKKKKKTKKPGWTMPAIALEPIVWQGIFGVVGIAAFIGLIWFLMRWPDAETLDAGMWKTHEKELYKIVLPGTVTTETQSQAGMTMYLLRAMPSKDAVFGVAVSDGRLPAERRALGAEILLNDACNGSSANLEQMGAVEVARKSINLKDYPGKQLTMKIAQAKGYMLLRGYLVGTRLYILMVGGKGLHEKHPDVQNFFDSFQILEKAGEPAPGGQPTGLHIMPGEHNAFGYL